MQGGSFVVSKGVGIRMKIVIDYFLKVSDRWRHMPAHRLTALASMVLLLASEGCTTLGPDYRRPATPLQAAWLVDGAAPGTRDGGGMLDGEFWREFHDPLLLSLQAKAIARSPTLASTAQQMVQAEEQLRITETAALPLVSLSGSDNYNQPDAASRLEGKNEGSTTLQLLGQLSWEIDFWGKQRRAAEADRASLAGARAALAAARVSLEASVASAYCNVRLLQMRIKVAVANLAQQAENMRIAEARYRLGATSELDLRQAQTQYEQTRSQLPALRSTLAQYQHALSVLAGEPPDYFGQTEPTTPATAALPAVPDALPLGAPRDLLRRRPDVLQAELAAAAQSARIGQTEAALYPSFTLSGTFGFATTNGVDDLFRWNSRSLSRGLGFSFPLFERDQLKAQVAVRDSQFTQAVLGYQNQVLKAQQEVADALTAIDFGRLQIDSLQRGDRAAGRSADLALVRYRSGQTDYTTVSSAEQARLQTADALAQARGALLLSYISAYRALGGGWEDAGGSDERTISR